MTARPWTSLQVVPDDVLFFRDGKPNTQGDDHYLRSLFPPYPSTLYGALRSQRLIDFGVDLASLGEARWKAMADGLRREVGEWGGFGSLWVRGPWLVWRKQVLMPAPADLALLLHEKKKLGAEESAFEAIRAVCRFRFERPNDDFGWSHPLALAVPYIRHGGTWKKLDQQTPKSPDGWYLTPTGMDEWRKGNIPAKNTFLHASELWIDETRTGVGLERHRRYREEHMLYSFGFVRMQRDVALGFEVSGSGLAAPSSFGLGGEARTAGIELGPAFPFGMPPQAPPDETRFLLYFATPTLSEGGSYPPGFSESQLEAKLAGTACRLEGAAVKATRLVGGWNIAMHRAKPLRRAIPAGSVFLIKAVSGNAGAVAATLNGVMVSDFDNEGMARQGFGLALVGLAS